MGPARTADTSALALFSDRMFLDPEGWARKGQLLWKPTEDADTEEVLYFDRESPHRKYGSGVLHAEGSGDIQKPEELAAAATDTRGTDEADEEPSDDRDDEDDRDGDASAESAPDDMDIASLDVRKPSTMGLSFRAKLPKGASIVVTLPRHRRFAWQAQEDPPFPVNGRYEACTRTIREEGKEAKESPMWRRRPVTTPFSSVVITRDEIDSRDATLLRGRMVPSPEGTPVLLSIDVYPRRIEKAEDEFLVTLVLRNRRNPRVEASDRERTLYQAFFAVHLEDGNFVKYPETERRFEDLDEDEQSLILLYRDAATWAIGHGCAAGWDVEPGTEPREIYSDAMPAVELPSMTPVATGADGSPIQLRMQELASLPDDGTGAAWESLARLVGEYSTWIAAREGELGGLDEGVRTVAERHLGECKRCAERMEQGLSLLRSEQNVRRAFRLANLAMLLQQIGTKKISSRSLVWQTASRRHVPSSDLVTPWSIYESGGETTDIGEWRAFQIAFLLMQLVGMVDPAHPDRNRIDLIWFPTGGGKTEAYLGVIAFHLFHQRLLMEDDQQGAARDGTNVLMRYTLRMLTTQQFQRAASLICAMEFMRRRATDLGLGAIPGSRFGLGLWIGTAGSPKDAKDAAAKFREYLRDPVKEGGNPFVLTECPWCRLTIGAAEEPARRGASARFRAAGITEEGQLHCADPGCAFGGMAPSTWLPVEVVDSRIYSTSPSMVIATADKFAIMAYRPAAGAILGHRIRSDAAIRVKRPPSLIVQDELHLIAGPLGTMYGIYEAVIEELCTYREGEARELPKIIASTATIRGAAEQTRSLYGRLDLDGRADIGLFPAPGLLMGDSFFGVHARRADGRLDRGRLYVGIHAHGYGSILTAQVRAFAAVIRKVMDLPPERRDAWWTLLTFYNSIRELGGAKTLFDSDIRSRLKFLQKRDGVDDESARRLRAVEELTSRLTQAEIVAMMDRLSSRYARGEAERSLDACLASSIIEVGVDIDRLSLMGVVGQPKTTAQYIQVTGRVGRRWQDRPGLILTLYSPSKSRDRSHFEQFHSYHRRLYERVEPTSATPFASSAIQRAMAGAMLLFARQTIGLDVDPSEEVLRAGLSRAFDLLRSRSLSTLGEDDPEVLETMEAVRDHLVKCVGYRPAGWEKFPPAPDEEYLMLWPGQYYTQLQERRGVVVPSSMRQVDTSSELRITQAYALLDS